MVLLWYRIRFFQAAFKQPLFLLQFLTSSSGTNAVGILPGEYWGTPNDKPIIIGAHWDTVSTSPGYNDNGSGASALLVSKFHKRLVLSMKDFFWGFFISATIILNT